MDQAPELKRSLFGYRKEDVDSILEARERMFERVTEETAQRRREAEQLRTELDRAREETGAAREETQTVRAELNAQLNDVRTELDGLRSEMTRLKGEHAEAQTRADGLETELRDARREASGLTERLRVADATEADLRKRLEDAATTEGELRSRLEEASSAGSDTRELGAVLAATQDAIGRIMADARRTAEQDLTRVQRTRDEIQGEIERVRSWRDRIEPVTHDIAGDIAVAQAQMAQTAERVGEALRPMSEALTSLSGRLHELATVADPSEIGERPLHVDLVSHEQEQAEAEPTASGTPEPREAPAGTPSRSDPWPDPWR
jgi:chromosome segregation ATPase